MTIKISGPARDAIRSALTAHWGWKQYRRENDLSMSGMKAEQYIAACAALNIDIQSIIAIADAAAPRTNPKAQTARAIFGDSQDEDNAMKDQNIGYGLATIAPNDQEVARRTMSSHYRDEAAKVNQDMLNTSQEYRDAVQEAQTINAAPVPVVAPSTIDNDKMGKFSRMLADLMADSMDAEAVRAIVREEIESAGCASGVMRVILSDASGATIGDMKGHFHPNFRKLLIQSNARDKDGHHLNIWITGPAGSGKTYAVNQIAKAHGLKFLYNGAISMPHELLGFIDANGVYHGTPFRDAYENGGCYAFDEVDGSDAGALLALNAALANGTASFPDGMVDRHPDCIVFATANTWGHGATTEYVGRAKMDAAFLNRFVKVDWDYDNEMERAICGNPDFALRVQSARAKARAANLKVVISPRASIMGAALIAAGMTPQEAAESTYLADLTAKDRAIVEG